ncbi:MAG TPA: FHA domain-containing protein [Blastocatellia bacterium]|nr:FHA domain-containing protein [Blastocatellia bacterium]
MKITEFLTDFRKWLDGEDAVSLTPEPRQQLSEWDEFFVKIAREVENVMKREMFTPPGGPTYLPGEYIIYLSKEDDALWQGRKREGLEEGLRNGLSHRARELVGDRVLKTEKVALSLGVDGALAKGQIRVQAVWDDDSPRTEVTARRKKVTTVPEEPPVPSEDGEMTVVRARAPLFSLNYNCDGGQTENYSSYKTKIQIGRGSKDFPIDLKLEGDPEISRKHAILERLDSGVFKVECVGRNSIEVDGTELQPGQNREMEPGQIIKIGIYELKIAE